MYQKVVDERTVCLFVFFSTVYLFSVLASNNGYTQNSNPHTHKEKSFDAEWICDGLKGWCSVIL